MTDQPTNHWQKENHMSHTWTAEELAARELQALHDVAEAARKLQAHGTLVFRNGDDGQRLSANGTFERTAYAFVVPVEDRDSLADALDQLEQSTNPDWP